MDSDKSYMKQDCPEKNECLKMLQAILDGEATPEQKTEFIEHHLDECLPCYKSYHLEVAIRQLLKTKCSQQAPQDLIEIIKSKCTEKLSS
jgi:anti-sigma factor (TIGR02949 family)